MESSEVFKWILGIILVLSFFNKYIFSLLYNNVEVGILGTFYIFYKSIYYLSFFGLILSTIVIFISYGKLAKTYIFGGPKSIIKNAINMHKQIKIKNELESSLNGIKVSQENINNVLKRQSVLLSGINNYLSQNNDSQNQKEGGIR